MKKRKKKLWVQTVKTVSTSPPEGIFTKDAETIAKTLAKPSVSPKWFSILSTEQEKA
jgi:hypothetical protein